MNWLKRGKRLYLYLARWQGGKCRNIYVGPAGSRAAELALAAEQLRAETKAHQAAQMARLVTRLEEIRADIQTLTKLCERIITIELLLRGYTREDRHDWKHRRRTAA